MKLEAQKGRYGSVEVIQPLPEYGPKSHVIIATFWHTGEDGEAEKNAARFIAMHEEETP